MIRPPPISTLFPYTTLFRSVFTSITTPPAASDRKAVMASTMTSRRIFWTRRSIDSLTGSSLALLVRSEEHTSELQSRLHLVCRLLLEKKKKKIKKLTYNKKY